METELKGNKDGGYNHDRADRPLGVAIIASLYMLIGVLAGINVANQVTKSVNMQDISGIIWSVVVAIVAITSGTLIGIGIWQGKKWAWLFVMIGYTFLFVAGVKALVMIDDVKNDKDMELFFQVLNVTIAIFMLSYFSLKKNVRKYFGF